MSSPERLHCSFSKRSGETVAMLIAGPNNIFICNECVALASKVVVDKAGEAIIARSAFERPSEEASRA